MALATDGNGILPGELWTVTGIARADDDDADLEIIVASDNGDSIRLLR